MTNTDRLAQALRKLSQSSRDLLDALDCDRDTGDDVEDVINKLSEADAALASLAPAAVEGEEDVAKLREEYEFVLRDRQRVREKVAALTAQCEGLRKDLKDSETERVNNWRLIWCIAKNAGGRVSIKASQILDASRAKLVLESSERDGTITAIAAEEGL